ncbi:MAG: polysaccharide deacetylase family protein [Oscillospiraceae bacterium]|nr:polysaccharide deacetylase family protein [Oscillospiraceae bacterium]
MNFDINDYSLGKRPLWAIFASLLIFIAMAFFVVNCIAMGEGSRLLPIYSVETQEKKVAVTFNCAWEADDIPEILALLEKYEAKATFFILGQWAEDNPDEVKMIANAGHEIGNHSNTHPDMAEIGIEEAKKELLRSSERIEKSCGVKPVLFRAPSGSYSSELIKTAAEMGFMTIQWDVDSRDWKDKSAGEMVESVTKNVRKGSIILFHSGKKNTLEALPQILEILKNGGYEFVKVSELVYTENYTVDHTGRQHKL